MRRGGPPYFATAAGLGARLQEMRRYDALLLTDREKTQLVKMRDMATVWAETDQHWS